MYQEFSILQERTRKQTKNIASWTAICNDVVAIYSALPGRCFTAGFQDRSLYNSVTSGLHSLLRTRARTPGLLVSFITGSVKQPVYFVDQPEVLLTLSLILVMILVLRLLPTFIRMLAPNTPLPSLPSSYFVPFHAGLFSQVPNLPLYLSFGFLC